MDLGSSPNSAVVAGLTGLAYCFAATINPRGTATALDTYRRLFRPLLRAASARPYVLVAVSVTVAETEAAAARLRASLEIYDLQLSAASRRPSRPRHRGRTARWPARTDHLRTGRLAATDLGYAGAGAGAGTMQLLASRAASEYGSASPSARSVHAGR